MTARRHSTTKLIAADVDGTIIGPAGVHPSTWDAIDEAHQAGIRIALCTGRIAGGEAVDLARRVGADELHIFASGAVVAAPGRPAAHSSELPAAAVCELVALSRRTGLPIELCTHDGFSVEWHSPLTELHAARLGITARVIDAARPGSSIVGAVWVLDEADWPRVREATEHLGGTATSVARTPWAPGAVFANITRSGTSKGTGLHWLRHHHRLRQDEVVMVGDDDNDLDAFAEAGTAIAMRNGSHAAIARARHTVAPSDEGGFADAVYLAMSIGDTGRTR